jgi:hypothetical protein
MPAPSPDRGGALVCPAAAAVVPFGPSRAPLRRRDLAQSTTAASRSSAATATPTMMPAMARPESFAVARGCRLLALLAHGAARRGPWLQAPCAPRVRPNLVGQTATEGARGPRQRRAGRRRSRQLEGGSRGGLADEHDEFPPLAGLQEGALDKPVARARAAPCAVPSSPSLGEARTDARAPVQVTPALPQSSSRTRECRGVCSVRPPRVAATAEKTGSWEGEDGRCGSSGLWCFSDKAESV